MLVWELKQELQAQGLPTDGTRPVLYQRVQKARRINRLRGRPLWVPPLQPAHDEEKVNERLDELMKGLTLKDNRMELLRMTHEMGADMDTSLVEKFAAAGQGAKLGSLNLWQEKLEDGGDQGAEEEEDEPEEVEEESDDEEEEMGETTALLEDGEELEDEDDIQPAEMLAVKMSRESTEMPKALKPKFNSEVDGGSQQDWLGLSREEKIRKLVTEKRLDPSNLYTMADAWGWTWEQDLLDGEPEKWSLDLEIARSFAIFDKVLELKGKPTEQDCGTIARAAIRSRDPLFIVDALRRTHRLGYSFGTQLYVEAFETCVENGDRDAAAEVMDEMNVVSIEIPEEIVSRVQALLALPSEGAPESFESRASMRAS